MKGPFRRTNSAPIEPAPAFHRSETDPMVSDESGKAGSQHPKSAHHKSTIPPNEESDINIMEEHKHSSSGNGWGKGIVADFNKTIRKHWKEEMTNFSQKTVAVSFFLFFACISPAITFGAIYAKATHNWIGAVEMISATAWCGIVYALIGGQPMMINGGTGPVLAFAEILYKMSESLDVPFLTFNAWVGLWVCIYMIVAAVVDLNRIIVYATRFTDEIFSLLIASIFIINALGNPFAPVGIFYYFDPNHKSHDEHEDVEGYSYMASALLSLLIFLGTVYLAFQFRRVKFSPFLPNQILRNAVTDFAVVMAIFLMTFVANVIFRSVPTETLNVPNTFAPTYACCTASCDTNWPDDCPDESEPYGRRSWLVDLGDLNGKSWVPFMAAGPAVLAFILVFLDDGITWHLINHPTHKIKHGSAYNYDTVIIGLMVAINSLLGLPWLVAATVRSLNHVHAMAEKLPSGKISSVTESRLTHLGIHLLCLVSIFALDVLKLIPVPVLYGVFLFMGLVSLGTNTFWCRILMFFMQPSKYPVEPYTEHMRPRRMHFFTILQLALFVLLYIVKAIKTIAIAFPIIIALCIPIRLYLLPKIFTEKELIMIDSSEEEINTYLASNGDKGEGEYVTDHIGIPDVEMQTHGSIQETTRAVESEQEVSFADEDLDAAPPLGSGASKNRSSRRDRRKSVSCPPHMLFAELPKVSVCVPISEGEESSEEFDDTNVKVPEPPSVEDVPQPPQHRRRRHKSVSCPAHTLFAEAERHIASNYFFG